MSKASKVIFGTEVLIDLTSDTVSEDTLLSGATAHDKSGNTIVGKCTYDSDTQDATVSVAEILAGKKAYARGSSLIGTMPNNGSVQGVISSRDSSFPIPQGYHDGSGAVGIDSNEKSKLIPSNIRAGVEILGVEGTMSSTEGAKSQSKDVTPTTSEQLVLPDEGYNYLSQVKVSPIPYKESENAAGGLTIVIG